MKSMLARLPKAWSAFVAESEPDRLTFRFIAVFAGIWCLYDYLDIRWQGTAGAYWLVEDAPALLRQLKFIQAALCGLQLLLCVCAASGRGGRRCVGTLLAAALVLRSIEAFRYFGLNDFFYYCVTAFILLQHFTGGSPGRFARWPREALRFQTAWIYGATAILKLSEHWVSGSHLWIRQAYLSEVGHWPYPGWARELILRMDVNHALAAAGAVGELSMAVLLALGAPAWLTVPLAVGMHGFAALSLNVWFFGACMIAQVAYVSAGRRFRLWAVRPRERAPGLPP